MDKRVPEIRFKGFTDDWEQQPFGDFVNRKNKISNSNSLPKIEFQDIISGEGRLNKDISQKFDTRKGIVFEPNDILYGKLRPYLKKWVFATFKGIALGDFWVFKATKSESLFIYYLIQTNGFQKVANNTSGTKMPRSDWKKVSQTDFYIPKYSEQEKIEHILGNLDDIIEQNQNRLIQYRRIKTALLQKMFPEDGELVPKIRFTDFHDNWEQHKFKDIVNIYRGLTYTPSDVCSHNHGIRVLRSSNIKDGLLATDSSDIFVAKKAVNVNYASKGDILITSANGSSQLVGKHALIDNTDENMVAGGFMLIARTKESLFVNELMNNVWYAKFIFTFVAGGNGAIGNLKKSDLEEQEVLVPKNSERKNLGIYFDKLESLIRSEKKQIKIYKKIKKYYLKKLFL